MISFSRARRSCVKNGFVGRFRGFVSKMSENVARAVMEVIIEHTSPDNFKNDGDFRKCVNDGVDTGYMRNRLFFISADGQTVERGPPLSQTTSCFVLDKMNYTWKQIKNTLNVNMENYADVCQWCKEIVVSMANAENSLDLPSVEMVRNKVVSVPTHARSALSTMGYPSVVANSFHDPLCPPLRRALNIVVVMRTSRGDRRKFLDYLSRVHETFPEIVMRNMNADLDDLVQLFSESVVISGEKKYSWKLPCPGFYNDDALNKYINPVGQVEARKVLSALGIVYEDTGMIASCFTGVMTNGEIEDMRREEAECKLADKEFIEPKVTFVKFPCHPNQTEEFNSAGIGTSRYGPGVSRSLADAIMRSYQREAPELTYEPSGKYLDSYVGAQYVKAVERKRALEEIEERKIVKKRKLLDIGSVTLTIQRKDGDTRDKEFNLFSLVVTLMHESFTDKLKRRVETIGSLGLTQLKEALTVEKVNLCVSNGVRVDNLIPQMERLLERIEKSANKKVSCPSSVTTAASEAEVTVVE